MALLKEALVGIPTVNAQQWRELTWVMKWLIASRASVLPLTLFAVTFAVCLAQPGTPEQWLFTALAGLALVLAHATNNLINDYVDHATGVDKDNYFRVQYGVHVLESGLLTKAQFLPYLVVTGVSALALGGVVCWYAGGLTPWFAGFGAFFVLFYTYPLKRMALGEIAVFLTWGPLMVGGTYLVIAGQLDLPVLWAGVVYGLGPTVVIFAKHTDKAPHDRKRNILTLPVLLGHWARYVVTAITLMQIVLAIIVAFSFALYGLVGIVFALPAAFSLVKITRKEPPAEQPSDYPTQAWPLWYTTYAFRYARDAGLGLTLGVLFQNILS